MKRFLILAVCGVAVLAGCERARCMVELDVVDRDGNWVKPCSVEVLLPEDQLGKKGWTTIINNYNGPPPPPDGYPGLDMQSPMFRFSVPWGTWVMATAPGLTGPGVEVHGSGLITLHLYPPTPPSKAFREWRDKEPKR